MNSKHASDLRRPGSQLFNNPEGRGANRVNIAFADLYKIMKDTIDPLDNRYPGDVDALCQQICVKIEKAMGTFPSPYKRDDSFKSVTQDWVMSIPLRQQGVLILALRGPDGVKKEDPAKPLVRTLRGMIMNAGRTGEPMKRGVFWRDDPFMTIATIDDGAIWDLVTRDFFDSWDAYNVHFLQHFAHAYAVCGMHYPDDTIQNRAWDFYVRCCHKLHMTPETPEQIVYRLRDGVRKEDGKGD